MRITTYAPEGVPRGFGAGTNDAEGSEHCMVPQCEQLVPRCRSCLRRSLSASLSGRVWARQSAVASSERFETIPLARACARTSSLIRRGPAARPGAQIAWVFMFLPSRNCSHSIEERGHYRLVESVEEPPLAKHQKTWSGGAAGARNLGFNGVAPPSHRAWCAFT